MQYTTGSFTVLAPTDAAFTDLAEELGVGIPELLEKPKLIDILLYHVLPEVLREEVLLPASISFFSTISSQRCILE
ncbi:MAG: fasciclin domain-containing protein [Bacteroidia bacterium]|nr:fasciclin domain-containing protein [Bacteroidia bacterium]